MMTLYHWYIFPNSDLIILHISTAEIPLSLVHAPLPLALLQLTMTLYHWYMSPHIITVYILS